MPRHKIQFREDDRVRQERARETKRREEEEKKRKKEATDKIATGSASLFRNLDELFEIIEIAYLAVTDPDAAYRRGNTSGNDRLHTELRKGARYPNRLNWHAIVSRMKEGLASIRFHYSDEDYMTFNMDRFHPGGEGYSIHRNLKMRTCIEQMRELWTWKNMHRDNVTCRSYIYPRPPSTHRGKDGSHNSQSLGAPSSYPAEQMLRGDSVSTELFFCKAIGWG
jgi:hypothetical protein